MLRCMRTTIRLDDDLLAAAKRRANEHGTTLTQVIEDALREALAREPAVPEEWVSLPSVHDAKLRPGVDLDDSAGLRDLMDGLR